MQGRRIHRGKQEVVSSRRVVGTGFGGSRPAQLRREPFGERAGKLLETMQGSDPRKASLRRGARKTLSDLIDAEGESIRESRKRLFKGRSITELTEKRELISLNNLEMKAAELEIAILRFNGEAEGSKEVIAEKRRLEKLRLRGERLASS